MLETTRRGMWSMRGTTRGETCSSIAKMLHTTGQVRAPASHYRADEGRALRGIEQSIPNPVAFLQSVRPTRRPRRRTVCLGSFSRICPPRSCLQVKFHPKPRHGRLRGTIMRTAHVDACADDGCVFHDASELVQDAHPLEEDDFASPHSSPRSTESTGNLPISEGEPEASELVEQREALGAGGASATTQELVSPATESQETPDPAFYEVRRLMRGLRRGVLRIVTVPALCCERIVREVCRSS